MTMLDEDTNFKGSSSSGSSVYFLFCGIEEGFLNQPCFARNNLQSHYHRRHRHQIRYVLVSSNRDNNEPSVWK